MSGVSMRGAVMFLRHALSSIILVSSLIGASAGAEYFGEPTMGANPSEIFDSAGLMVYSGSTINVDRTHWIPAAQGQPEKYTYTYTGEFSNSTETVGIKRDPTSKAVDSLNAVEITNFTAGRSLHTGTYTNQKYLDRTNGFYVSCTTDFGSPDRLTGDGKPIVAPPGQKLPDKVFENTCKPVTKAFCEEFKKIFAEGSKNESDLKYCQDFENHLANSLNTDNRSLDLDNVNSNFAEFQKSIAKDPSIKKAPNSTLQMIKSHRMQDLADLLYTCNSRMAQSLLVNPKDEVLSPPPRNPKILRTN